MPQSPQAKDGIKSMMAKSVLIDSRKITVVSPKATIISEKIQAAWNHSALEKGPAKTGLRVRVGQALNKTQSQQNLKGNQRASKMSGTPMSRPFSVARERHNILSPQN